LIVKFHQDDNAEVLRSNSFASNSFAYNNEPQILMPLDLQNLQERLRSAIATDPALAKFLHELCRRSFKTGALPQRSAFRDLAVEVIKDLRFIFGARAVKEREEKIIFDLDAAGLADSEARHELLRVLTTVLGVQPQNQRGQRELISEGLNEKMRNLAPGLRHPLPQKVLQRLAEDFAEQRGYLWREGLVKKKPEQAWKNLTCVLAALEILAREKRPWNFSELGAQVSGSSKSFRPGSELYRLAADWALPFLEEAEALLQIEEAATRRARVWEQLGVEANSAAITVMLAGPLVYQKKGKTFSAIAQHFEMGEASTLSLAQLADLEHLDPLFDTILTIENFAPFAAAAHRPPLPAALLIYTEGFPNRGVRELLRLCFEKIPGLKFLHWGDTDLAGVRIMRNLAAISGATPTPFRCGPEDIAQQRERLIALTPEQRENIERDLQAHPHALGHETLAAVLQYNGWLEQEAWQESS
jgi:hypothetical protein